MANITMRGTDRLIKTLERAKKTEVRRAGSTASRAVNKMFMKVIKRRAPRRKGIVAKQFQVKSIKRSRKYIGTQVKTKPTSEFHAAFVELGTKHQDAQNFMQGAFDSKQRSAQVIFERIFMAELLKKIATRRAAAL